MEAYRRLEDLVICQKLCRVPIETGFRNPEPCTLSVLPKGLACAL
jgi:hypothetical protein